MPDEHLGQLQIGEVALRTELSVRTLRHYHDIGLVEPSARSAGGFRLYTESDVERLLMIRHMKPLGFTLPEMRELLDSLAVLDDTAAPQEARSRAVSHLASYHTKARESAARLRRQLTYAEELTELLANRSARKP